MMTLEMIEQELKHIDACSWGDYEIAHGAEDELYANFVRHVAEHGPDDLAKMAMAVLRSQDINFPRYRA